ncbi:MAG: nucleotidyltransferase family protein [Magnetospirillum sp.]|jgi:MurNAc alpha-1-phosphate uridylyltransferase|nr:nucleotidyltransferase family protein [Magnetospirillum sp.]
MSKIRTAMVLAAGLGKRMRPLTDTLPKPLVEVAGRSLIDRVFDRLIAAGVTRIVVNLHHHRAILEAHIAKRSDAEFALSPEAELLETGGGVLNALPLLGSEPFYCVNADVLWFDGATPALVRMAQAWNAQRPNALLLMNSAASARGYEGRGDYFMDGFGRARRRQGNQIAPFVYAGVQILKASCFAGQAPGRFSLNRVYDALEAAEGLVGIAHDGLWFHVGTPESVAETEFELGWSHARPYPPAR